MRYNYLSLDLYTPYPSPLLLTVKRSRLMVTRVKKETSKKIGKRLHHASKYPNLSPINKNNNKLVQEKFTIIVFYVCNTDCQFGAGRHFEKVWPAKFRDSKPRPLRMRSSKCVR